MFCDRWWGDFGFGLLCALFLDSTLCLGLLILLLILLIFGCVGGFRLVVCFDCWVVCFGSFWVFVTRI